MLITVLLPNGKTAQLEVADTDLVYDGLEYVSPSKANYIELYTAPMSADLYTAYVSALSLPFNVAQQELIAAVRLMARVISSVAQDVTITDPTVVSAVDPSDGECICFITCSGTELRFVKVQVEEP